ncbi:MAG: hypothetical protein OXI10_04365 [Gammaproteobacteria bacterium]|nr:hypothetical protein [Gammaproteobacteria bacterium]
MRSLSAMMRADARLAILQALSEDRGYSLNHMMLREFVDRAAAITLCEDEVREHLSWLEDRGAVTTESVPPFLIAKLTNYGLGLARGHNTLDGVSRPLPEG